MHDDPIAGGLSTGGEMEGLGVEVDKYRGCFWGRILLLWVP